MDRMTTKQTDGRWALKRQPGITNREQMYETLKAIDRLGAYEDTGLEPEDVAKFMKYEREAKSLIRDLNELMAYRMADQERRLKVWHCALGDHVWVNGALGVGKAEEHIISKISHFEDAEEMHTYYHADMVGSDGQSWVSFYADQIGKTVFLTREEAEKALEGGTQDV